MSIAEKLVRIAEREQRVYDAGYWGGYGVGKQEEYDRFWDEIQANGTRTDYQRGFACWGCEYVRPKYKVAPVGVAFVGNLFYLATNLRKVEKEYFDFSQCLRPTYSSASWYYSFYGDNNLEEIEDIGITNVFAFQYTFANCNKLKTIARICPDTDTTYTNVFNNCNALESLTIDGVIGQNGFDVHWSTKLTRSSIESIINALSPSTSGLTVTLSKTAVNNAFDGGSTGDEWLNLIATKSNWAISLG